MSSTQNRLGRGINALYDGNEKDLAQDNTNTLPIARILPNPGQPRRKFNKESLQELADSIKAQGIVQPLLVRPMPDNTYQIVAGERRWRAAKLANLREVPVYIREMDDKEVMAAALIENLQREDLNPMEEAIALKELRETMGITQDELATRLGKSRSAIANTMRLLQLTPMAQADVRNGAISPGHARGLLSVDNVEAAEKLRKQIHETSLTVREVEEAATCWKNEGLFPWEKLSPSNAAPLRKARSTQKRKKDAELLEIEKQLSDALGCRATLSGDTIHGRMTISYGSAAELKNLLKLLGEGAIQL